MSVCVHCFRETSSVQYDRQSCSKTYATVCFHLLPDALDLGRQSLLPMAQINAFVFRVFIRYKSCNNMSPSLHAFQARLDRNVQQCEKCLVSDRSLLQSAAAADPAASSSAPASSSLLASLSNAPIQAPAGCQCQDLPPPNVQACQYLVRSRPL